MFMYIYMLYIDVKCYIYMCVCVEHSHFKSVSTTAFLNFMYNISIYEIMKLYMYIYK